MGNCCGGLFRSSTPESAATFQSNNLSRQRSKRERNWAATGQIALRDAKLKELPASVAAVGTSAKVLDATNNKLTLLPSSLSDLANLQRLALAHNLLTSVQNVASLKKLKVLVLDHNRLAELPMELGTLPKLEKLQCSHNILTALPASFGQLTSLMQLDCSSNKIESLPQELASASQLESIDASDNYLKGVPSSFGSLKRLRTLVLDQNQVATVPPEVLTGCEALQTLSLHSNPVTAQDLEKTAGFEAFEGRRRSKVDKQITGGAAHNLDEGVDRLT